MSLIRLLWRRLVSWWRPERRRPLHSVVVDEVPDELDPKLVYIAGEKGHFWFVAMVCPCGCGETLHMNLLPDTRPRWFLTIHEDRTVSLSPSVWRQVGCRSHFFLVQGNIQWS